MLILNQLAVLLVIFDGIIIIHCGVDAASSSIKDLPDSLVGQIINKAGFETFGNTLLAVRNPIAHELAMDDFLKNRIVMIAPYRFNGKTEKLLEEGESYIKLGSEKGVVSFFEEFGHQVKKLAIFHTFPRGNKSHNAIIRNILENCVINLEELRVSHTPSFGTMNQFPYGKKDIIFPKVKKLVMLEENARKEFNLHILFPRLESVTLQGFIDDKNCLADVTTLKELELMSRSISEDKLDTIFSNNKDMTSIIISWVNRRETMESIARNLKKLKSLSVFFPDANFFLKTPHYEPYYLPSVLYFGVYSKYMQTIDGDLSFRMPNLKRLNLRTSQSDDRIINFIEHFNKLDSIHLNMNTSNTFEFIKKIKHVKEVTMDPFSFVHLKSLQEMFENFDEESDLQSVELIPSKNSNHTYHYEMNMNEINEYLKQNQKPTWTLSRGEHIKTGLQFLLFKRDRRTCESSE